MFGRGRNSSFFFLCCKDRVSFSCVLLVFAFCPFGLPGYRIIAHVLCTSTWRLCTTVYVDGVHALRITRHTRPRFFQCILFYYDFFSFQFSFTTPHRASLLTTSKSPGIPPPSSNQHARFAVWGREAAIRAIWLRIRIAQLVAQTAGTKIC